MVGCTQSGGGGKKGVGGQLEGLCMEKCWGNMSKPPYSCSSHWVGTFLLSESHRQVMGYVTNITFKPCITQQGKRADSEYHDWLKKPKRMEHSRSG